MYNAIDNTNQIKRQHRHRSKGRHIARLLTALTALILINCLLSFLLEPYMGSSEEMWANYRRMPQIDTIYVGTSQCLTGIDPSVADGETGGSSYNMATNMQSFADSEEAIRCAIQDYGIRRVVLAIDHEMLGIDRSDNARADESFWHGKALNESIPATMKDSWRFMTDPAFFGRPASLTYLTPWVYNRCSDLRQNLREKLTRTVADPAAHRSPQGFHSYHETLDPSWHRITWEEADAWDSEATDLKDLTITASNRKALQDIHSLCLSNNVQLIAVILPYPNHFSIYRKSDYLAIDAQLAEIFADPESSGKGSSTPVGSPQTVPESAGAIEGGVSTAFYDFNLILPEYYDDSSNDLYADVGHMNTKGAAKFSVFLGDFLNQLESGKDLSHMFRNTDTEKQQ